MQERLHACVRRALVLATLLVIPLPAGGAALGGEPTPLVGDHPAWLDGDALATLRAGGWVELPETRPPTGLPLAPGGWLLFPNWCTLSFVFRHSGTGALGIGTAGHCIQPGQLAEEITIERRPDGSAFAILRPIGQARASWTGGIGHDFALIEIFPWNDALVDPAMRGARGPCGIHDGILATGPSTWIPGAPAPTTAGGLPLVHVGHAPVGGLGGAVRIALGSEPRPEHTGTTHIAVHGAVAAGDSGSPVRLGGASWEAGASLAAAGILTHAVVLGDAPAGHAFGTSMPAMLRLLGPEWELVDDPLCAAGARAAP